MSYVYEYVVKKTFFCGSFIEHYDYSIPIKVNYNHSHKHVKNKDNKCDDFKKRDDNLNRAVKNVRRIIMCNLTPHTKFLTLTVKDNITDVKTFRRMITTFFQQMKRKGYDLKYLYVLERQKRGAIHAHLVVFNDEKIPLDILNSCWHYGNTDIKILNGLKYGSDEHINNVANYVVKYITKDSVNEWGSRCYNCSLNLRRPTEVSLKVYGDQFGYIADYNSIGWQSVEQALQQSILISQYSNHYILNPDEKNPVVQMIDFSRYKLPDEYIIKYK